MSETEKREGLVALLFDMKGEYVKAIMLDARNGLGGIRGGYPSHTIAVVDCQIWEPVGRVKPGV